MRHSSYCKVCSKACYVQGHYTDYCSNACKQKAYRERKAKQKAIEALTLDLEQYPHTAKILEFTPEMEAGMYDFLLHHGKDAYYDMVALLNRHTDEISETLIERGVPSHAMGSY